MEGLLIGVFTFNDLTLPQSKGQDQGHAYLMNILEMVIVMLKISIAIKYKVTYGFLIGIVIFIFGPFQKVKVKKCSF